MLDRRTLHHGRIVGLDRRNGLGHDRKPLILGDDVQHDLLIVHVGIALDLFLQVHGDAQIRAADDNAAGAGIGAGIEPDVGHEAVDQHRRQGRLHRHDEHAVAGRQAPVGEDVDLGPGPVRLPLGAEGQAKQALPVRDFDHFGLDQQLGEIRADRSRHLLIAGKHGELDTDGKTHGFSSLSSTLVAGAGAVLRCAATG